MADESATMTEPTVSRVVIERSIDVIAKLSTILSVAVYGCGFLVSSIYQSEYGFSETNPFRPRVLSAGIWFLIFLGIPFLLNIEFRNISLNSKRFQTWIQKSSSRSFYFAVASYWFGVILSPMFEVPQEPPNGSRIFSSLAAFLILLVGCALFTIDFWGVIGMRISEVSSVAIVVYLISRGARDAFLYKRASGATLTLWILLLGWLTLGELNSRSWKWKVENWLQSGSLGIATVITFATFYYPGMKYSWGGGSPIPATLYFTKESAVMPN